MKYAVNIYHIAITILIMFAGTFVWFMDPTAPMYDYSISEKIIFWIAANAMTTVAFLIGPIFGFTISRFILFGGVPILGYIILNRICASFGEVEVDVAIEAWGYIGFSIFNTLTAYAYSDKNLNLFHFNLFRS